MINVDVEHDGNGFHAENNFIEVDHGDGTFGCYLHLRQGGSYVKPGQRVRRGEVLAASGNVGMSMLPHLHFHVIDDEHGLVPVTFADVESDHGIPRMFKRCTRLETQALDGRYAVNDDGRPPTSRSLKAGLQRCGALRGVLPRHVWAAW